MADDKRKTVSDGLTVRFDKRKRERLRKALEAAQRAGLQQFTFEEHEYVVRYAEYLLEYLDLKL